MMYVCTCT